jgi:hypothetical protein
MSYETWSKDKRARQREMIESLRAGDRILVDSRILTASPEKGKGTVVCEVLQPGLLQTYVAVCSKHQGPLYVFNSDIRGVEASDEHPRSPSRVTCASKV